MSCVVRSGPAGARYQVTGENSSPYSFLPTLNLGVKLPGRVSARQILFETLGHSALVSFSGLLDSRSIQVPERFGKE